jgi:hypothetical protein
MLLKRLENLSHQRVFIKKKLYKKLEKKNQELKRGVAMKAKHS